MKPGVTCVVGQQEAATIAVLEQRARAIDAPLFVCGPDRTFEPAPNGFRTADPGAAGPPHKPAPHRAPPIANAPTAITPPPRPDDYRITGRTSPPDPPTETA